jgi:Tfp pilus assembly protein PilN
MTRREKFEEAGRAIKKALVLLVLTSVMIVIMALGLSLSIERSKNNELENRIMQLEEKQSTEASASYDVIYVERR